MIGQKRAVVAGLALRWREFHASGASGGPRPGSDAAGGDASSLAFGLWVPECGLDTLVEGITQEEFARSDERLPYFGRIWPAAEALVARLLAGPALEGLRALDLGCGLGACGFAAARRGARVTFFDWEPRALAIVAASARAQTAPPAAFACVVGDWRVPPPCGPFDLILAADVLYEARNGPAVAAFLARHLAPGTEAWLADPGRPHAAEFPALAEREGLDVESSEQLVSEDDKVQITVLRVRTRP